MRSILVGALTLAALAALAAAAGTVARAQTVVSDLGTIRACLCAQQSVIGLQGAVTERRQNYAASQKALASLTNQVATRRAQINVYNDSEVAAYKQLLEQRDAAAAAFAGDVTQSYDAAVARYNQAVAGYNSSCAGKSYDQAVLGRVQAEQFSCPKP
jgi:hypothetical protein